MQQRREFLLRYIIFLGRRQCFLYPVSSSFSFLSEQSVLTPLDEAEQGWFLHWKEEGTVMAQSMVLEPKKGKKGIYLGVLICAGVKDQPGERLHLCGGAAWCACQDSREVVGGGAPMSGGDQVCQRPSKVRRVWIHSGGCLTWGFEIQLERKTSLCSRKGGSVGSQSLEGIYLEWYSLPSCVRAYVVMARHLL